jgi:hypothetical protein
MSVDNKLSTSGAIYIRKNHAIKRKIVLITYESFEKSA